MGYSCKAVNVLFYVGHQCIRPSVDLFECRMAVGMYYRFRIVMSKFQWIFSTYLECALIL